MGNNPYDWQSHNPQIEIPRAAQAKVVKTLGRGGSAVVLGGRGMGKSVFLHQVRVALEREDDVRVVVIPVPPPDLTVRGCLDQLSDFLSVPGGALSTRKIIDAYYAGNVPERLVLLFDEFDRYAERVDLRSANPPGRGFFNDVESVRRDVRGLGVMATGSLGIYVVRDVLGSSFLSRAVHIALSAFERAQVGELARPFAELGSKSTLPEEVLDALHLTSGGVPSLVTFALEQLWDRGEPVTERDIADVFAEFIEQHGEYLRDLLRSISDPSFSNAPWMVLQKIRAEYGPHTRAALEATYDPETEPLDLVLADVLKLLRAAGLVHFRNSSLETSDPIVADPIAGLLNLPASSPPPADHHQHLRRDLTALLAKLHRSGADFFRPGNGKRLVPEAVFATWLALGFELLGWHTEREAQNAAGRTDLKLRRNGDPWVLVIEVKIWGRNDYLDAQQQIESYWSTEVVAGAVIQITDADVKDWAKSYQSRLKPQVQRVEPHSVPDSPVRARLDCVSETPDGLSVHVDHFLLRLPRRS